MKDEINFEVVVMPNTKRIIYCISCSKSVAQLSGQPHEKRQTLSAVRRHGIGVFSHLADHELVTLRIDNREITRVSDGIILSGDSAN